MSDSPHELVDTGLQCPECGYNLTGATEDRCPWCGQCVDIALLEAAVQHRPIAWPVGVVIASLTIAFGAILGLVVLLRRSQGLRLTDGFVVLGVASAALGLLALAVLAMVTRVGASARTRETDRLIRLAGWLAVVAGIIGATSAFHTPTRPLPVTGGMTSGLFEFVLRASLFSLPGWLLLLLRSVSIAVLRSEALGANGESDRSTTPTEESAPFIVEGMQRFDRAHIEQTVTGGAATLPPALVEYIAIYWKAECDKAAKRGHTLHNGKLVRLAQCEVDGSALCFQFEETCFRDFAATNLNLSHEKPVVSPRHRADPLGVSAAIMTSDGFLAWGRRSDRVYFHRGHLQAFGGMLEQDDRVEDGRYDLFGRMARELSEELGVSQDQLATMTVIGLVRDKSILQPELLFDVEVNLTRRELTTRFSPARSDGEHTAIEFLYDEPEGYLPFLIKTKRITPVAQAMLLLHGRLRWGAEWYEQICYALYGDVPQVMSKRSETA